LSGRCSQPQLQEPLDGDDEIIVETDFFLPPPEPVDPAERNEMVTAALQRIWDGGKDLSAALNLGAQLKKISRAKAVPNGYDPDSDGLKNAVEPGELWMLLSARLATRGVDVKRKEIVEFVIADFARR